MRMQQLLLLLFVGVVLCVASPVFGETIFFDDFERGAMGTTLPIRALEAITNDQPAIGLWTVTGQEIVYGYKGEWHPAGGGIPDSHVFGGKKFGLTIRSKNNVTGGTFCNVNATFVEQSNASDMVRFEADVWGQIEGATTPADLKLAILSGTTEANAVTLSGGATIGSVSVGGVATNLTYALNQWHHVTMDYYPTTATFDLAIDSQTLTGLAMTTPSAVDGFRFVQTSAGQDRWVCYDNVLVTVTPVPEPSTLALLACGLFGLLTCGWRKR